MELSKDDKYLLEHEEYLLVSCPICDSGNVVPKQEYSYNCNFCGRLFEYKSGYKN